MGISGLAIRDSSDMASSQVSDDGALNVGAAGDLREPLECCGHGVNELGAVETSRVLSECCNLCIRPINRCEGLVEDRGAASEDAFSGPLEQVLQSPSKELDGMRRFSSPPPLRCSTSRSLSYDEDDDSGKWYYSPLSEFSLNTSDTDSVGASSRAEKYSCRSVLSSPLDSPLKTAEHGEITPQSRLDDHNGHISPPPARSPLEGSDDVDSAYRTIPYGVEEYQKVQKAIDFENNLNIWYPPDPADELGDVENGFFEYDDEEIEAGDSAEHFKNSSSSDDDVARERPNLSNKEILRSNLHGHFRALVSQLLLGQGIVVGDDTSRNSWLEIVSALAWEAANYVKPDTSKGGSMDPGDYVKVKCISSGCPADSTFIRGVVCSKNVKHKRMVLQHKNPRLFLLGGALEYQKSSNKLASINCVLEQEKEYLKMVLARIEALRPNVLLVEKSASSHAQELLSKDISLVLNIKRPLLERISQCTGAQIAPSIENLAVARLGHCKMFRVEREMECSSPRTPGKKSMKTLMYFEGCPRRLGCTILLRGGSRDELKKIKNAVQFAVFAAYQLSLETSFLADEGASLPMEHPAFSVSPLEESVSSSVCPDGPFAQKINGQNQMLNGSFKTKDLPARDLVAPGPAETSHADANGHAMLEGISACQSDGVVCGKCGSLHSQHEPCDARQLLSSITNQYDETPSSNVKMDTSLSNSHQTTDHRDTVDDRIENDNAFFSSAGNNQSILVSLSVSCPPKSSVCERPQLIRIKFYGTFDKPLGRFLRENLFGQKSCCPSCKQKSDAHVRCYTHHQGSLTISVRQLPSGPLPGEQEGKIWMWHRCLRCQYENGFPPATPRVVMSDAARGLSFGKFLELSFSNHTTAKRVASCGHSLQKDCLRFYGFGSMVAVFRHSPVDILSVNLPQSVLDFSSLISPAWIIKEATSITSKNGLLHKEISIALERIEKNVSTMKNETLKSGVLKFILEMKDLSKMGSDKFNDLLQFTTTESGSPFPASADVLILNRLKRELLEDAYLWGRRIYMVDCLTKEDPEGSKTDQTSEMYSESRMRDLRNEFSMYEAHGDSSEESFTSSSKAGRLSWSSSLSRNQEDGVAETDSSLESLEGYYGSTRQFRRQEEEGPSDEDFTATSMDNSSVSSLSDQIDLAWTGSDGPSEPASTRCKSLINYPSLRKVMIPGRAKSFDHALTFKSRVSAPLPDDPKMNVRRAYSQKSPQRSPRLDFAIAETSLEGFLTSDVMGDGGRLLPHTGRNDSVILIYDDEPSSMIAYALTSGEYDNFLNRSGSPKEVNFTVAFEDASAFSAERAKFSVTSYFARQFEALRKQSCPCEVNYVRSLSRCKRWNAQGGKSNAYFAKTLDGRFILKQVTRTELDSFEEFAPEYFRYLSESLASGSPTCIAKILGIYQVVAGNLKGGREVKMDLMVMENLFYKRNISRIYDLKGSLRSRYNPDTSGSNKVLLDLNLLETLHTKPIFLGSKAKRRLERAVWNDTAFLASMDVMDYSLLVGIDEERKELVIGIIDFLRQYTWDKQLETWVKASGILGGPKNTLPTVISPIQYKKRFRKAMSEYFLTVPDPQSP